MYNKFRAVSSIQVIIELCVPVLAVVGLSKLFFSEESKENKIHALKWSAIITGGLALVFLLFHSMLFNFSGAGDGSMLQQLGPGFVRALKEDRKAVFTADTIRSLIFVVLTAAVIWLYLKQKVNRNLAIGLFALLILVDLVGVDRRYVNNDDFVSARVINKPFQANQADLQIMQDEGHYRVFDLSGNPFNTARTSYFHNSIGGYHAAKPGRMQDLFNFYISRNHMEVLNMLNTKYFIVPTEEGVVAQQNPETNGNAWFVSNVQLVENANEEILALENLKTTETAVVNENFRDLLPQLNFPEDNSARIELESYEPNEITYNYSANAEQLAVFSEIYYPQGWHAYIDGEEAPHFRANYVLRAMVLPQGQHTVTFKFEPEVVKTGSTIALASSVLLGLLLVGGIFYRYRKNQK